MKVQSPFKVKEVKFQRRYPGYLYRREIVDDSEHGGTGELEMVNCYALDTGDWIGGANTARYLCIKRGLRLIQKSEPSHCVASIGYQMEEDKWYGWSHRASFGFGIGDKLFEENYGDEDTKFSQHGSVTITTTAQAKQAAKNFGEYVS